MNIFNRKLPPRYASAVPQETKAPDVIPQLAPSLGEALRRMEAAQSFQHDALELNRGSVSHDDEWAQKHPLHAAAFDPSHPDGANLVKLREALNQGADVNALDEHGRPALAVTHSVEAAKMLIEANPVFDADFFYGDELWEQRSPEFTKLVGDHLERLERNRSVDSPIPVSGNRDSADITITPAVARSDHSPSDTATSFDSIHSPAHTPAPSALITNPQTMEEWKAFRFPSRPSVAPAVNQQEVVKEKEGRGGDGESGYKPTASFLMPGSVTIATSDRAQSRSSVGGSSEGVVVDKKSTRRLGDLLDLKPIKVASNGMTQEIQPRTGPRMRR